MYLGHWVEVGCVKTIEAKVEALRDYPRPRKKEIRADLTIIIGS